MVKYNESESESEDTSHASEPRFRVRVCMQRFYSTGDLRALAYVCVSPHRRVRWLQRRLRRLFDLPRLFLMSQGHLLPPQEPLALLQPDDPVEVIPADVELDDDVVMPEDVVDCADEVPVTTVEETQRSPSSVNSEDLVETKRKALIMLDQYRVAPVSETVPRPRRRRVRRRRRVPQAAYTDAGTEAASGVDTNAGSDLGTDTVSDVGADAALGVGTDSDVGTDACTDPTSGVSTNAGTDPASGVGTVAGTDSASGVGTVAGTDSASGVGTVAGTDTASGMGTVAGTAAGMDADDGPARAALCRAPEVLVQRNELQRRVPRVVRSLPDRQAATLQDHKLPTEIVVG